MRKLKKIIIFITIALVIQGSILFYLEKYRFTLDSNAPEIIKPVNKSVVIKVGNNPKAFKISQDGKFISYLDSNVANVVNTITGEIKKISIEKDSSISFYKWLEGNNTIIYAEKFPNVGINIKNKGVLIKFFYYNAEDNSTQELRGKSINNSIYIEDMNVNSQVTDISISPIANVMYIKLTQLNQESVVYKLENMSVIKKMALKSFGIGNIGVNQKNGSLYYEDLNTKKIRNANGSSINIDDVVKPIILGVDKNDNIYFGDVESGKISKIYWGILDSTENSFNAKELKVPTEVKNIFISESGNIFLNDNLRGIVTEINSGSETEYKGILKCMYDKGIASIDDGKVLKVSFK